MRQHRHLINLRRKIDLSRKRLFGKRACLGGEWIVSKSSFSTIFYLLLFEILKNFILQQSGSENGITQTRALQKVIEKVYNWRWELGFRFLRKRLPNLGRRNNKSPYTVGGTALRNDVADSGFLVVTGLSFDRHCEVVAKKARKSWITCFDPDNHQQRSVDLWVQNKCVTKLRSYIFDLSLFLAYASSVSLDFPH